MIDLEKEREDFEKWYENVIGRSLVYKTYDKSYLNSKTQAAWEAWQAAKDQAIPKGFVLVSQKKLMELAIAINAVDLATHTEEKPNEVREMWQQVALKLGALCSTGASQ